MTIPVETVDALKEKYGGENAVAGYVEEAKIIPNPLPKYYVLVADDENISLVQMSMKHEEKNAEVFPLSSLSKLDASGSTVKTIIIETSSEKFKLYSKPLALGRGDHQENMFNKLTDLKK